MPLPPDTPQPPPPGTPDPRAGDSATGSRRLELDGRWQRVSGKYLAVELVGVAVFGVITIGATVIFAVTRLFPAPLSPVLIAIAAVVTLIMLIVAPRRVRAIGYQLRRDDLLFRRGIMFHRVVAVPYGRMQLIDINRGPVARYLGLAELKFVTAAASTAVTIPGLTDADADALRDTLVGLAETRRAGL